MPNTNIVPTTNEQAHLVLAFFDRVLRDQVLLDLADSPSTRLDWPDLASAPAGQIPDGSWCEALCPRCQHSGLLLIHRFCVVASPIRAIDGYGNLLVQPVSMPAPTIAEAPFALCTRCHAQLEVFAFLWTL